MSAKEQAERAISVFSQLDTCDYRHIFVRDIMELFEKGWEFRDVLTYLRTFEEVSPNLEEEVAFQRRDAINAKYLHLYINLREHEFKALAPLL